MGSPKPNPCVSPPVPRSRRSLLDPFVEVRDRLVDGDLGGVRSLGLKVEPLQGLLEVDYGKWTGRPLAQLYRTRTWKQLQAAPSSVRFPGGESLADVQRRCVSTLEVVASRHASKAIAVFAHA